VTREEFIGRAADAITQHIGPERFRLEVAEAVLEAVGAWDLLEAAIRANVALTRIVSDHPYLNALLPMGMERERALDAVCAAIAKAEGR
jgi:hypothetical protein